MGKPARRTALRPIRIAAQLHPQHGPWSSLRTAVLRAEELGYDIAYNWDHFFPLYGDRDGAHLECWTTLAAWAEATSRIEIGALVTCNSYRNPDLLADMARTVDHVAGGRLILGLGSGWFRRDYESYGYEFGTAGGRLRDLGDALPRIEARLAALNPPPVRPMPVLIAGRGIRRTTRLVAQHADAWHAAFPDRPDELEPAVAALRGWCDEIGRDPASIEWGVGIEPDDLDRFLAGEAATYLDMGFTQFTLGFNGPAWDVDAGAAFLAWRDERNAARALAASARAGAGPR
jgi:probable F420-dependent oxidoreductase